MKLAVVGAGAIGGVVGAMLHRAGRDVVLVDTNVAHVSAINATGLRIDGDGFQPETFYPRAVSSPDQLEDQIDIVFLAVKSTATRVAVQSLLPHLKPTSIIVSLQNGMGNEDVIAEVAGPERMVSGVVGWGATFTGPGHITKTSSEGGFEVGEWGGGESVRARAVAEILNDVAPTVAHPNILGTKWTKLIVNATINSLGAAVGRRLSELVADPRTRLLMLKLTTEGVMVAEADGVQLEKVNGKLDMKLLRLERPEEFQALRDAPTWQKAVFLGKYRVGLTVKALILGRMAKVHGHIKSSMWQDLERGSRTEIDVLNGYILQRARARGVRVPITEAIASLIHEIERGERTIDYRNTYLLEASELELPEDAKLGETSRTAAYFFISLTETFAQDLGWGEAAALVNDTWSRYTEYYSEVDGKQFQAAPNELDRVARRWQSLWFDRQPTMQPTLTTEPGTVIWTSDAPCQYWNVARSLGKSQDFEWPLCHKVGRNMIDTESPGLSWQVLQRGCQGGSCCQFVLRQSGEKDEADAARWETPPMQEALLLSSNTAGFFFAVMTQLAAQRIGWERANSALERFWENLGTTFTKQVLAMFQISERDSTAALRTLIFLLFNRHPDMIPSVTSITPEHSIAANVGGCRYWEMATKIGVIDKMEFPACLPLLRHLAHTVNPDLEADMVQRQCQGGACCELHLRINGQRPMPAATVMEDAKEGATRA